MVVVSETKESQLLALLEQCVHLDADVRPRKEKGFFTVTVPPPWNGPARRAAQAVQDQIKEWSKQYHCNDCIDFRSHSGCFHFAVWLPVLSDAQTDDWTRIDFSVYSWCFYSILFLRQHLSGCFCRQAGIDLCGR